MKHIESISILGVRIDVVTRQEALAIIDEVLSSKHERLAIATVNPEFIIEARQNKMFAEALANSGLAVVDGVGILWAGRVVNYRSRLPKGGWRLLEILGVGGWMGLTTLFSKRSRFSAFPEKISGSDFSIDLSRLLASRSKSLFLLGEKPGIAEKAAAVLQSEISGLHIAGYFAGDGSEAGDQENLQLLSQQPSDALLVAYGAPKQDIWIDRNLSKIPARVAMGVGGTFLFLAGEVKRAPRWMQDIGIEWLYRLITQPWRWRRQMALPRFIWAVLWDKAKQ